MFQSKYAKNLIKRFGMESKNTSRLIQGQS